MEQLLIKGGRVVDAAAGINAVRDVLIKDGVIARVAEDIAASGARSIEAKGKLVLPGAIDMHVHLREPGREDKETVATGTRAALKGGITTCLAMPNTFPAIDSPERVRMMKGIIERTACVDVLIAAAITEGRLGKGLTDIAGLAEAGAVAISDDGASVDSEELMRQAMRQASSAGILVICHCEDRSLSGGGVVNRGLVSTRLGLRGISRESEYTRVARDVALAEETGCRIHIAHVSCGESVEIIAAAKKRGVKVTAETAPHYFALTEEAVLTYDTNMKMNPPLRGAEDRRALCEGLRSGAIDVIASDHAPHTESEKAVEFARAEFGVVGLETLLAVGISELVLPGLLSWSGLVEKVALNPARILGLGKGTLCEGASADVVILDPERDWKVEKKALVSKSKNSAFLGRRLKGYVEHVVYRGSLSSYARQG